MTRTQSFAYFVETRSLEGRVVLRMVQFEKGKWLLLLSSRSLALLFFSLSQGAPSQSLVLSVIVF